MAEPDDDIRERARELVDELFRLGNFLDAPIPFDPMSAVEPMLRRIVKAENERCARIAEAIADHLGTADRGAHVARDIAAAIRSSE